MSSTVSWDEIKRLAADFQRVQLTETSLKLSEINCIELINKLIELDMLKVYHSIDGKEYITDQQLEQDIYDELYVHGGRINLCDLQVLLNIDISHIEKKTSEIVKNDSNLVTILGQIISKDYMNKLAEEINEMLQEKCRLTISELTTFYELPTSFMLQILEPRVGSIIKGNFDGNIFYTLNYVKNQKALLSGALEACIKPIRMAQIVKEFNLEPGMIFETYDNLISSGQIKGSLYGGRQEMSAVFVPEIYVKAQQQYVQSFFNQNGYVEYSSLKKIGVTEPDAYVHDLFKDKEIKYLSGSCFSSYKLSIMEEEIEDTLNGEGYCDLSQILPSTLNENDLKKLAPYFSDRLESTHQHENEILQEIYLCSKVFLKKLAAKFQEKMEKKSGEDLKEPNVVLAFRTERAIIAGSNQSASQQADTKKTKGKGKKSQQASSDQSENVVEVSFVDKASLSKELNKMVNDLNDDLLEALVDHFLKTLNHQYFDLLKSKVESGLINSSMEEGGTSPVKGKNTIKEMQEKLKLFLINAKIFEKGVKTFPDPKTQDALNKHLIKTVFSDMVNDMVKFIANENMIQYKEESLNGDSRSKIIQKFKDQKIREGFNELHLALSSKPVNELIDLVEKCAVDFFELSIRKQDMNKREKEVLLQQRESTKETLGKETDAATILQLTCILLYQQSTGAIVNLPGRIVPTVLEALKVDLVEEHYSKLIKFQNLIIESLKETEDSAVILSQISNLTDEVKQIGLNAKTSIKSK